LLFRVYSTPERAPQCSVPGALRPCLLGRGGEKSSCGAPLASYPGPFRFILAPVLREHRLPVSIPNAGPNRAHRSYFQGLAIVSQQEDRNFFDTFMMVLAALIVFTVAIYALSNMVANRTIADRHVQTEDAKQQLAERVRPEGRLCIRGQEEDCEVAVAGVDARDDGDDELAEAEEVDGQQVYNQACTTCHGQGVAGAPVTGDEGAWSARVDKGYDTLLEHSIEGFQGDAGYMPARGGNRNLSDEQVAAALDYMLEQLD